jgi:micrococcal nuclease
MSSPGPKWKGVNGIRLSSHRSAPASSGRYTAPMLAALLFATSLAIAPARLASSDGGTVRVETEVRVVSVHDGDTITVKTDGRTEKVRLVGIDTPELDDERDAYRDEAVAAREFVRLRLKGKAVSLERDGRQGDRDDYARLLRYVILPDGTNFNEELVRKGYARVYDRFAFSLKGQFKKSEAEAKREHIGVWALPPGKPRQTPAAPPRTP